MELVRSVAGEFEEIHVKKCCDVESICCLHKAWYPLEGATHFDAIPEIVGLSVAYNLANAGKSGSVPLTLEYVNYIFWGSRTKF